MVIHVNTYGHMQLDSLTREMNLGGTVHVLSPQDQPLPLLLEIITTVNLEEEVVGLLKHITSFADPLWDGAGCSASNTCCSNTDQPWFHHQLNEMTQDDIEVRICRDQVFNNEGILIDILELYIY